MKAVSIYSFFKPPGRLSRTRKRMMMFACFRRRGPAGSIFERFLISLITVATRRDKLSGHTTIIVSRLVFTGRDVPEFPCIAGLQQKYVRLRNAKGKYAWVLRSPEDEKKKKIIRVRERITGSRLHIRLFSSAEQMHLDNSIFNFYRGSKLNELEYLRHARFSFDLKISFKRISVINTPGKFPTGSECRSDWRNPRAATRSTLVKNQSIARI